MALIKDYYVKQYEITIPNCYWKIETRDGLNGGKTEMNVRLGIYKDKATADGTPEMRSYLYGMQSYRFIPDLTSNVNIFSQAYNYIKTLPEFSGATNA